MTDATIPRDANALSPAGSEAHHLAVVWWILLAMGALMIPTSVWVFSWAERRAKRLGLLKRSG